MRRRAPCLLLLLLVEGACAFDWYDLVAFVTGQSNSGPSPQCNPSQCPLSDGVCYCTADRMQPPKACPPCPVGYGRQNCGCEDARCSLGECVLCVKGQTFKADASNRNCTACAHADCNDWYIANECTVDADRVLAKCDAAPPGMYCQKGECQTLQVCRANSYCVGGKERLCATDRCASTGMSAPTPCTPGSEASNAMVQCNPCERGKTSYAGGTACADCARGTYASSTGSAFCQACGAGTYVNVDGASACLQCDVGKIRQSPITGDCAACAPGKYAVADECQLCIRGKFRGNDTGLTCSLCPVSTYASTNGATQCDACPPNTHTDASGSQASWQCLECLAGWYLSQGACVACDVDRHYCPGKGARVARTQPVVGQTYVQLKGSELADDYLAACSVCEAGVAYALSQCSANLDTVCHPCAAPVLGETYLVEACTPTQDTLLGTCDSALLVPGGACNLCPPGTTLEEAQCVPCRIGHFKAGYGAAECTPCPPNTLSMGGASRCTVTCAHGSFAPNGKDCTLSDMQSVPWRTDALPTAWDVHGLVATGASFFWVVDAQAQVWRIDRRTQAAWQAAHTTGGAPRRLIALSERRMLLLSEFEPVMVRLDVATEVTLTATPVTDARLRRPTGGAALGAWGVLIADYEAHCVWALLFDAKTNQPTLQPWRGTPNQPSTEQSRGSSRLLAFPLDVAFDAAYASEPAYVLDAHGVWSFFAMTVGPNGQAADLTYVCGGGATLMADGVDAMAIADVNLAGSRVVELALGRAGNRAVLFMLSTQWGVWALSSGATELRRIGDVVPRALVWSDGRLWGLRSEGGVAEAGLGAVVALDPSLTLRCLCDAGLYCEDSVGACVVAPAGTVAPAWASKPVACPSGTLFDPHTQTCGECVLSEQYTTFKDGATTCQRRCEVGQVYYADACHPGCNGTGQYLLPSTGCATCPLGTEPDGLSCRPCAIGFYGSAPGVCSKCEGNATTLFLGATRCLPCGDGLSPERIDSRTWGQCVEREAGGYHDYERVPCHDQDGPLSGACNSTAQYAASNVSGPLSVTSTGQTVVWDAEVSDHGDERFEARGTCVRRNGQVWVGDCDVAGDADGARSTRIARLQPVVDLALVAVDGVGAVLYLSTWGGKCASVRGAALYDGTLSTLLSEDATRLPTLLWDKCVTSPIVIAAARGVEALLLSDGVQVWLIDRVLTRAVRESLMTTPSTVTALCMRGHLKDGAVGMALIANDAGHIWLYGAPSNVSLWRTVDGVRDLACAGRHAWWIDGRGEGWTAGLGEAWVEGCLAGFVRTVGHGCAQVGVGQFTITGETVHECPAGTYGTVDNRCVPCPPGSVSAEGEALCLPCPRPQLASGSQCVSRCPPGTVLQDGVACAPCPSGSSNGGGATPCAPCAAGEYVNASTDGVCAPCPEGFTSRAGSVRCVVVCPPGQCAPKGDTCESLTQDWAIITSVHIEGGFMLTAVTVGEGGTVFYADGGQLYYFLDDCVVDATVLSVLHPCERAGEALLPENPCPACVRGFTALALAGGFDASYRYGGSVRFVYALSYSTHTLYRFPIRFQALSGVLVDVDATRALLATGGADLSGWRLAGGAQGMVDGPLSDARFNMPMEMELSRDDRWLYVSDSANQRIRVVDLLAERVRTLVGDGTASWQMGPIGCVAQGCARVNWPGGMGLSPSGRQLYLTQYGRDSVGVVDLAGNGGSLSPFCQLNWQNKDRYRTESCVVAEGSRSCFLYRPFDVLASPSGRVYVASTNALTVIDASTLVCQQVGGEWWAFRQTAGFQDGGVGEDGAPLSRLSRPSKLALDASRGILYVADFSNGALRRAFVDGECRCAQGAILLGEAQACYNPTPAWDVRQKRVADCPPGHFALEGDVDCRVCEASVEAVYGVAASACLLWRAQAKAQTRLATSGFSFARVRSTPEPEGASHLADWFGDPTVMFSSPVRWNDIVRANSPVTYRPGVSAGRVPYGGEFVSLKWRPDVRLWERSAVAPKRLVPGLWYPCAPGFYASTFACDCSTAAAAFADPSESDGGALVRWHELRLTAAMSGARVLTTPQLKAYVDGSNNAGEAVTLWSLFLARGVDVGPTFPVWKHYGAVEALGPETKVLMKTPTLEMARCVAGWPAHYECAEGYVWVGPNTTALNASQFVRMGALPGQIACLSCLPGTYSRRSSSAHWAGGAVPLHALPAGALCFGRGHGRRVRAVHGGHLREPRGRDQVHGVPGHPLHARAGGDAGARMQPVPPWHRRVQRLRARRVAGPLGAELLPRVRAGHLLRGGQRHRVRGVPRGNVPAVRGQGGVPGVLGAAVSRRARDGVSGVRGRLHHRARRRVWRGLRTESLLGRGDVQRVPGELPSVYVWPPSASFHVDAAVSGRAVCAAVSFAAPVSQMPAGGERAAARYSPRVQHIRD